MDEAAGAAMAPVHEEWIADVFSTLAAADKRRLVVLLATLKTTLTEQEDPP